MNVMKKMLLFILALMPILYSCKNDNEPEPAIGLGTDPELNISEYTFGKEGGHLEVYSTIGSDLMIYSSGPESKVEWESDIPVLEGEWYKVTFTAGRINDIYSQKRIITIDVKPNDTGKERTIPFDIMAGNFGCQTSYKQAAE